MTLKEIVETRNLRALEAFCLRRTYDQVIEEAKKEGIDPDELEELLYEIS